MNKKANLSPARRCLGTVLQDFLPIVYEGVIAFQSVLSESLFWDRALSTEIDHREVSHERKRQSSWDRWL